MKILVDFVRDESGQGITEYGAILAFVAILIVVVASFVSGHLRSALALCFTLVASALTNLTTQV
jgi:Flp pilus assembly pilin Flp